MHRLIGLIEADKVYCLLLLNIDNKASPVASACRLKLTDLSHGQQQIFLICYAK